ncbi:MAG: coiled coil domain-containing protein [Gammaproteobacteria bacterium]
MELKDAYQDKMDARLREWQAKIDALKARADQAEAEQKIQYYEEIETLRTKQQKVKQKLEELRSAGASAWQEVKAGVEVAWTDLEDAVQRATDKFK